MWSHNDVWNIGYTLGITRSRFGTWGYFGVHPLTWHDDNLYRLNQALAILLVIPTLHGWWEIRVVYKSWVIVYTVEIQPEIKCRFKQKCLILDVIVPGGKSMQTPRTQGGLGPRHPPNPRSARQACGPLRNRSTLKLVYHQKHDCTARKMGRLFQKVFLNRD